MLEIKREVDKTKWDEQKWLIWHSAALQRGRKLVPFSKFMSDKPILTKAKKLEGEEAEFYRKQHEEMVARMEGRA